MLVIFRRRHFGRLNSLLRTRFFKFGLVGGLGIVVNLAGMVLAILLIGWKDWRASYFATSLAILHNYVLNNLWTFRERKRTGRSFFTGYLLYSTISLVGLAVTSVVYELLTRAWASRLQPYRGGHPLPILSLLLCQFVAILSGVLLNFLLNKNITWRPDQSSSETRGPYPFDRIPEPSCELLTSTSLEE